MLVADWKIAAGLFLPGLCRVDGRNEPVTAPNAGERMDQGD